MPINKNSDKHKECEIRALAAVSTLGKEETEYKTVNKVLSEKELAKLLGLSPWTVRTLRLQGLPCIKTAGRVFYRLESVNSYFSAQEQLNTKHEATPEYGTLRKIK